jgi:hypothetical protein
MPEDASAEPKTPTHLRPLTHPTPLVPISQGASGAHRVPKSAFPLKNASSSRPLRFAHGSTVIEGCSYPRPELRRTQGSA